MEPSDPPVGFTDEKHPELFEMKSIDFSTRKTGQLSKEQIEEFYEKGYTIVKDYFSKEELTPVCNAIADLVDNLANKLHEAGKITQTYSEFGFYERIIHIEKEFPGANILITKTGVIPKAFQELAQSERLLNLLEDFIGPDIAFNPIWNIRTKTPQSNATIVPWHQDGAYLDKNAYKFMVMSAWIPLIDATIENGTMEYLGGGHLPGQIGVHTCCWNGTFYVMLDEDEMENRLGRKMSRDAEVLEVPMGSFILFNQFVPHRSLPNVSKVTRWAVDFRWQSASCPDGYFGMKQPCILRLKDQPEFKPDWDAYNKEDRSELQNVAMTGKSNDPFNTLISGPWMRMWHILEHNRHTESLVDDGLPASFYA